MAGARHRHRVRPAGGARVSDDRGRRVMDKHPDLMDALGAFAARADSQVIVVMAPTERDPAVVQALERRGVAVRDGGRPRVRDGRRDPHRARARRDARGPTATPPSTPTPTDDRPWLAGMERLDDPRSARRFVTSACCTGGCAATSGRRHWRWP